MGGTVMPAVKSSASVTRGALADRPSCERELVVSTAFDMGQVLDKIAIELAAAKYRAQDIFAVRLALEEAVTNGMKHGNEGDARKRVQIHYRLDRECLIASVQDEGPGFDPQDVPDPTAPENLQRPSGRGIFLMHHFMTWVRFNEKGNCVTLCKYRKAS